MSRRGVHWIPMLALCLACSGPAEESSPAEDPEPVSEAVEEVAEESEELVELSAEQVTRLAELATFGEALDEPESTTEEEPCCTQTVRQTFALEAIEEGGVLPGEGAAEVTCKLTCSGSACAMVGCEPSPAFGDCSQFNCGLDCTGSCVQTISSGQTLADALLEEGG